MLKVLFVFYVIFILKLCGALLWLYEFNVLSVVFYAVRIYLLLTHVYKSSFVLNLWFDIHLIQYNIRKNMFMKNFNAKILTGVIQRPKVCLCVLYEILPYFPVLRSFPPVPPLESQDADLFIPRSSSLTRQITTSISPRTQRFACPVTEWFNRSLATETSHHDGQITYKYDVSILILCLRVHIACDWSPHGLETHRDMQVINSEHWVCKRSCSCCSLKFFIIQSRFLPRL